MRKLIERIHRLFACTSPSREVAELSAQFGEGFRSGVMQPLKGDKNEIHYR